MPYTCGYCGGAFCSKHRLPENHDCKGLGEISKKSREEGRIYRDVSESIRRGPSQGERDEEGIEFSLGSGFGNEDRRGRGKRSDLSESFGFLKGLFFRRVTMIILVLMFVVYIGQTIAKGVLDTPGYRSLLLYLAPTLDTVVERPWTLLTSIFVHGSFLHFFINGLVLFFIGSPLERKIGRNKFILLFLGAGVVASFAQILVIDPFVPVLGASGAILGCLGGLTAISPRSIVLLFFFIPMPLWMLTLGYGAISVLMHLVGAYPNIGHMAHFVGLVFGLAYGYKLKKDMRQPRHPLQKLLDRYS